MDFIQLGWVSRVDEMILARVSSGFAGEKVWEDIKLYLGFCWGGKEDLWDSKALVTLDGEGVDWTSHSEDEQENYALMACSSSGSDTKVTSCSKECKESYAILKKLYDEQREQLGDASIEIQAYTQALKKVGAQLVADSLVLTPFYIPININTQ
ncbi:hypothetical protein Tco_0883806 [Tanacetum coccineum]